MIANTAQINSRTTSIRPKSEKRLSNGDLLARLMKSRAAEHAAQRSIVCDLAEVERRRLYLPLAYGSLFEFCTDYLNYSHSTAARRIRAARCIVRFPRMAGMFRREECDLTVLAAIAPVVTKENCAEIAQWLRGKSLREVEAFVQRRQPCRAVRDQVRQIFVMSPVSSAKRGNEAAPGSADTTAGADKNCSDSTPSAGSKMAEVLDNKSLENCGVRSGSGNGSSEATRSMGAAPAERVVAQRKFKIQFAVDPAFMEKFKRVRSLLSTKYPNVSNFEMIFDILMTGYLDRHSPESRMKKRERRGDRGAGCGDHGESGKKGKKRTGAERTRHIPQSVRDEIFVRDGGRCAFTGTDGRRCEETKNLQIDHIIPYAKGGDNSPENLRLLCAQHNRLAAEHAYGKDFMKKYSRRE